MAEPGDLIITMGAGDVTELGHKIADCLCKWKMNNDCYRYLLAAVRENVLPLTSVVMWLHLLQQSPESPL